MKERRYSSELCEHGRYVENMCPDCSTPRAPVEGPEGMITEQELEEIERDAKRCRSDFRNSKRSQMLRLVKAVRSLKPLLEAERKKTLKAEAEAMLERLVSDRMAAWFCGGENYDYCCLFNRLVKAEAEAKEARREAFEQAAGIAETLFGPDRECSCRECAAGRVVAAAIRAEAEKVK